VSLPVSGPLSGRAAIVIGGTRGIGGAISRGLADKGASVAMFYQHRGDVAAVAARGIALGGDRARVDEVGGDAPLAEVAG
jgi:3-oxoacyl-[acyl-carrier protein] reductase